MLIELNSAVLASLQVDVQTFMREMQSGVRWSDIVQHPLTWSIVPAATIALLIAVGLRKRAAEDREEHGPVHRQLCRELGVSASQQRLLGDLSRAVGLSKPGALLISRGCFDRAVQRCAGATQRRNELAELRQRLFESV